MIPRRFQSLRTQFPVALTAEDHDRQAGFPTAAGESIIIFSTIDVLHYLMIYIKFMIRVNAKYLSPP
ncbi:hypothetical protein D4R89_10180 [bacterium]|nr:MAG: hypothetical protein D4R89_10180 [bacterium]